VGGCRKGEIVTLTAGSGIGKSQLARELAHSLIKNGETVGYIALEENVKRTALGLMSIEMNRLLHLQSNEDVSTEEMKEAFDATVGSGRVYLYDHWGSTDSDNLLSKIRYLVRGCGCNFIVLDHISIVVSGLEGGDERRIIDNTMTKLRGLVEELNCGMILISHLKRPSGDRGHEDGAQTSLAQLRGSAAIGQLSDIVIGLERNQQDKDNSNISDVRVLKNRWSGDTGIACHLSYSADTGRMTETYWDDEDEVEIDF
jgi:twinkle protein